MPNDPRGSWSDYVWNRQFLKFGPACKTTERRDIRHDPEAQQVIEQFRSSLQFPAVRFNSAQSNVIAMGFETACRKNNYLIFACSILPEHVHLVIARHRYRIEQVINLLKGAASKALHKSNIHPLKGFEKNGRVPSCWCEGAWKVFLDDDESIDNAIRYVQQNPVEEGMPEQHWPFVQPYCGIESNIVGYLD